MVDIERAISCEIALLACSYNSHLCGAGSSFSYFILYSMCSQFYVLLIGQSSVLNHIIQISNLQRPQPVSTVNPAALLSSHDLY